MARVRAVHTHRTVPLVDGWEAAELPAGQASGPAQLGQAGLSWWPAPVPGTAAMALRAAGAWDLGSSRRFDAADWWYRCRFPHAEDGVSPSVVLRLGGLATVADVWLNGTHLLRSENMFLEHAVEVGHLLAAGNELVIRFQALEPLLAQRRPRPRWRTRLVDPQSLRFVRTTLLGRMPGWSPPVAAVGPWRPVVLEQRRGLAVEVADLQARVDGGDGVVAAGLRVRTLETSTLREATLAVGDARGPLALRQDGDGWLVEGQVKVPSVSLWWPHTHGRQPLYPVSARLSLGGSAVQVDFTPVGFRTLELDHGPDGRGFALHLNGVRLFCRGACWTPLDAAALAGPPAEYRAALEAARRAGMNMLRVGGTMVYEAEAFHDLCDELGVLVWQDFMFANMDYPADEPFTTAVRKEVRQVLDGLQLRPSLAVLCGNSEVEQQVAMLGFPRDLWHPPLFHEVLPEACRALAPEVPYWPSTPGGGELPFRMDTGTAHYYGVSAYLRPPEDARRAGVRFATECLAFANVPEPATLEETFGPGEAVVHHPRWKGRVPRDVGAGWDFEDVRDHYLAAVFGVDPVRLRYSDVERYLALSRVVTGELMSGVFAEWRRPGSSCAGGLVWLLRDLWPGAGWGVLDALGRPKAAYYYLRRALAPVVLLALDEGLNGLALHALNEEAQPLAVELRVGVFRQAGSRLATASRLLDVPPRGHASVAAESLFPGFMDLTYAYRFGPAAHDLVAATLVERDSGRLLGEAFHFPSGLPAGREEDLGLEATARPDAQGDYLLDLHTRRFAQSLAIEAGGYAPEDNHFHLAPGARRTVRLAGAGGAAELRGTVAPLNAWRPTRIVVA